MIVREKLSWLRMLFVLKGSALHAIWPRVLFITTVATTLTFVYFDTVSDNPNLKWPTVTIVPFTLVGVALGIFLGFRNNESYSRFWEGRRLWGNLVNTTRSLTRQVRLLVHPAKERSIQSSNELRNLDEVFAFHQELTYRIIAYSHALRHHLRNTDPRQDLEPLLSAAELDRVINANNVPLAILQGFSNRIHWAWQHYWISDIHLNVLEQSLTELTSIQGGCERIRNTPIPFAYSVLIHRIVALYCFMLPFGICEQTLWFTPLVVAFISYTFFGLDYIGEEIEEPFGTHPNDLPLQAICRTIEINLRELLGESELPPPLEPVDYVLM